MSTLTWAFALFYSVAIVSLPIIVIAASMRLWKHSHYGLQYKEPTTGAIMTCVCTVP